MTTTLITGADGHVGRLMARWLLDHSDDELALFVRARDAASRDLKVRRLGNLAHSARCRLEFGDLRDDEPFRNIDARDVSGILHAAAITEFSIDRARARAVNVHGTARVLDFARRCRKLRRFGLVSTIYAAGLRCGYVGETSFDASTGFANHYEWSKWRTERLLQSYDDLPWQIYRVATILGEDESGLVVQQNAIHNTLRLLFYGLLSVIPGHPATRVYFVSSEYLANAVGCLYQQAGDHEIFHVSPGGDDAVTLAVLLDTVYDAFLDDRQFAHRGILKPLFCEREAFSSLVAGMQQFGGPLAQAIASVAPFAPQLFCDKHINIQQTERALDGLHRGDSQRLISAVSRNLVKQRWGLRGAQHGNQS